MKSKEQKRKEAQERQAIYNDLSIDEKLARLQKRAERDSGSQEKKRLMMRKLLTRHLGVEALKKLGLVPEE